MVKKYKSLLPIIALSLLPTFLIWLPFFLRLKNFWNIPLPQDGLATIVANYDGPLFIVVAKTLYNPELVGSFGFNLPAEYYAAHFPAYSILIRIFATIINFPYAMLSVTIISSIVATYFFSKFIGDYVKKKDILWMTFIFSIFPARWLVVRSVGSSEPLFLASIIASLYFFKNKKYLQAGIWGAIAQFTKSPAILLFIAYFFCCCLPSLKEFTKKSVSKTLLLPHFKKYKFILLIPLSLLIIFTLYHFQYGDFLAYFHSGDNIHLFFPPFQIFNYSASWVGTFWLEEIIFVYLFGILGLLRLIKQKDQILFVSHRDLIRYSLPIVPFLFAAFSKEMVKKEFKIAIAVLIIPIYLFSLAYISQNVMPIANWAPLL
jgi:Gpi18-like mannosyltransferase